jgi:hypothetical protein
MNNNNAKLGKVKQLVALKKEADSQIFELESKLLNLENEYLTQVNGPNRDGSILKGVDGYLGIRSNPITPSSNSSRRKSGTANVDLMISDGDRVFTKAAYISPYHQNKDSSRMRQIYNNGSANSEDNGTTSDAELDEENPSEPEEEGEEEEQYIENPQSTRNRSRKK